LVRRLREGSTTFDISDLAADTFSLGDSAKPHYPRRVPMPTIAAGNSDWHIFFKDGEKVLPAETVFMLALEFWTQFIYHNGIAADETGPLSQ
jgi:hypothetical protein